MQEFHFFKLYSLVFIPMKKIINNTYANFYLNAADKFGLEYTINNEELGLITIFNEEMQLQISSNVLGLNLSLGASLAGNKVKTSTLLSQMGMPIPKFKTFKDKSTAVEYASKKLTKNKFVVVKPISGSLSYGITVKPSTPLQIREAVDEAFEGNSNIMIEEYIAGRHYRVTVLDDEVIAVTERIAANVTGDGINTLEELIKIKNVKRRKAKLPDIYLRKKDLNYLRMNKVKLGNVYPEGLKVTLQLGCDLDIGGERARIEVSDIPESNLDLFKRANRAIHLRFAGIDYISPNILIPFTQIPTAINEINSAPDPDVHFRDVTPHENYSAERIITKVFELKKITNVETETLPYSGVFDQLPTLI